MFGLLLIALSLNVASAAKEKLKKKLSRSYTVFNPRGRYDIHDSYQTSIGDEIPWRCTRFASCGFQGTWDEVKEHRKTCYSWWEPITSRLSSGGDCLACLIAFGWWFCFLFICCFYGAKFCAYHRSNRPVGLDEERIRKIYDEMFERAQQIEVEAPEDPVYLDASAVRLL